MYKFILNSIRSWVDSHIIDYPTALLVFRILVNLTKETKITILVFFVSLLFLFFVSPVLGTILLLLFTFYLLNNKKYKMILFVWGSFLFIWYLVFIACLISYDEPIIIKSDFFGKCYTQEDMHTYNDTVRLSFYLLAKYDYSLSTQSWFNFDLGRFCMETFLFLCGISEVLDVTIYVPSLFKGILGFFKFIGRFWGGKGGPSAECSPEKNSPHDSPPSPSTPFPSRSNRWGTKPAWEDNSSDTGAKEFEFGSPRPSFKTKLKSLFGYSKTFDADACNELRKRMYQKKALGNISNHETCVIDGRTIFYGEGGVWGKSSMCLNYEASADDILKEELFREYKRNEKKK